MMKKFNYKSQMAVPKIAKVVVNAGFGRMVSAGVSKDKEKIQENIVQVLSSITGQKPTLRPAKKSIAAFKLREGIPIGAMVTLRKKRMYDFLEKLIWVVLPRMRDFRGIVLKSFDENGNLAIGFKEYVPFPEVLLEREKMVFGLEVIVNTTSKNKEEGVELLRLMGFPLQKDSR